MKNRLWVLLVVLALGYQVPVFAASQWDKTAPAGSSLAADIDQNVATVNNEAVDRLLSNYRNGAYAYSTGSANGFSVSVGDLVISNSSGSIRRFRVNTSATAVTWSNMDTGSGDAVSTVYYYYAVADTDATTWTVMISLSSTTPTGATYYRKLGSFYNNSAGSIEVGGIIEMFSGFVSTIPTGYVICDGTNGTPDLSDRFVIGTKTGSTVGAVGTTGGELTGTGSVLRTGNATGDTGGAAGGADAVKATHTHSYPKYYALAFIMRQGVE